MLAYDTTSVNQGTKEFEVGNLETVSNGKLMCHLWTSYILDRLKEMQHFDSYLEKIKEKIIKREEQEFVIRNGVLRYKIRVYVPTDQQLQ